MSQNNKVNIDSLKSPIIQYIKTIIKEEQQTVLRGRLWIETKYYNEKGEVIKHISNKSNFSISKVRLCERVFQISYKF